MVTFHFFIVTVCLHENAPHRKLNGMEVQENGLDLQIWLYSFSWLNSSRTAADVAKKIWEVSIRWKIKGLHGTFAKDMSDMSKTSSGCRLNFSNSGSGCEVAALHSFRNCIPPLAFWRVNRWKYTCKMCLSASYAAKNLCFTAGKNGRLKSSRSGQKT